MKGKSTKETRYSLVEELNRNLLSFGNCFGNCVICPTCLNKFALDTDQDKFTAGHILPEASGGDEWTFLCKSCNSTFGTKQDKWFGEYLNILANPSATLLDAKSMSKYISIDGQAVNSKLLTGTTDSCIHVEIPLHQNPKGLENTLEDNKKNGFCEFSFSPEILRRENEIKVGYITAAYLFWFNYMGYSWVFQSSLDCVREQIMNCNSKTDGAVVIDLNTDRAEMQGIGVVQYLDFLYPCCIVVDQLVVFPAAPNTRSPSINEISFTNGLKIELLEGTLLDSPYVVKCNGMYLIVPDIQHSNLPVPNKLFEFMI